MPFEEGHPGGPGRPKGSLNKATKDTLALEFWTTLVADCADGLTDKEKIEIAFRALDKLLTKTPTLNGTGNAPPSQEFAMKFEGKVTNVTPEPNSGG